MPFVQAKCTNCGANLQVDKTKEAAVCPYCGTSFVVEKATNNYNMTNNISANVVNIYGENSADFVIRAGTLEKYNGVATDVIIPNNVKSIGIGAFEGCSGLTSVAIPNSVNTIPSSAFKGCGLTSVIIPSSIKVIGNRAFECCPLTSITIPDGVTKICEYAFSNTSLISVTIPRSVEIIEEGAFADCRSLRQIIILGNPSLKSFYDFDVGDYLKAVPQPFSGCDSLNEIVAPEEWKKAYYSSARCLSSYAPSPSPSPSSYSGNCYVATAIYGSYDCPPVWTLRRYRDYRLAETWHGRLFIHAYYTVSPTFLKWFGNTRWFRHLFKKKLDQMVCRLKETGIEDTPYEDKPW